MKGKREPNSQIFREYVLAMILAKERSECDCDIFTRSDLTEARKLISEGAEIMIEQDEKNASGNMYLSLWMPKD